jgi:glycosyltransferase involved in cell wall biosynthesis
MNEEKNVSILSKEIRDVFEKLKMEYEVIFVDDGSTDSTFSELLKLHSIDKRVKVIRLRKRFGKGAASSAGFDCAKGKIVMTMDGDLQDDPSDIPKFLSKLNDGYDVVCGWRKERADSFLKRASSRIANEMRRFLMSETIHDSTCGFKMYRKETLEEVCILGGMYRYIPSLLANKGFRVGEVEVKNRKRIHGKTKYGYERLLQGFLDLLYVKFWSAYQFRPLQLFGMFGMFMLVVGFILGCGLLVEKFVYGQRLSDRPALNLVVLLVILGIQFLFFGFISEILVRLYFRKEKVYQVREKML